MRTARQTYTHGIIVTIGDWLVNYWSTIASPPQIKYYVYIYLLRSPLRAKYSYITQNKFGDYKVMPI